MNIKEIMVDVAEVGYKGLSREQIQWLCLKVLDHEQNIDECIELIEKDSKITQEDKAFTQNFKIAQKQVAQIVRSVFNRA